VWCEKLVLQQGGFCAPGSIAISYVEQSLDMKFQDGSILCLAALCFSSDTPPLYGDHHGSGFWSKFPSSDGWILREIVEAGRPLKCFVSWLLRSCVNLKINWDKYLIFSTISSIG
jgi:hypothetical protein